MKLFIRSTVILVIVILTFTIIPITHAAGPHHTHPTKKSTVLPPFKDFTVNSACSSYYIESNSHVSTLGYSLYVELDGYYDQNGNYCGYAYTYAELYQPPFSDVGVLYTSVDENGATSAGMQRITIISNRFGRYWGLWSQVVLCSGRLMGEAFYIVFSIGSLDALTSPIYP